MSAKENEMPDSAPGADGAARVPQPHETPRGGTDAPVSKSASNLFDLRVVIAVLFGVYGVVLVIMGIVSGGDAANMAKTGGTNLNLDTGIAMLVIGALFVLWTVTRPLKLPSPEELDQMRDAGPGGH